MTNVSNQDTKASIDLIEDANYGKPKNPNVKTSLWGTDPNSVNPNIPSAVYEILNGKEVWRYNLLGMQQELNYTRDEIVGGKKWSQVIGTVAKNNLDAMNALNLPIRGYRIGDTEKESEGGASLWVSAESPVALDIEAYNGTGDRILTKPNKEMKLDNRDPSNLLGFRVMKKS